MALREALNTETSRLLIDSRLQDADVVLLRLSKARANLNNASKESSQESWLDIQDRLLTVEYNVVSRQEQQHRTPKSKEKYGDSIGDTAMEADPTETSVLDELNMLSSEMQLRNRSGDKIEVNSYQQDQLSADIAEMARTIKHNAEVFQKKLDADSDLVTTTTDVISRTAGSMSSVGSKLSQYRRETQLGWMFYIWSTLFIFIALLFGMAIIQIFGKW